VRGSGTTHDSDPASTAIRHAVRKERSHGCRSHEIGVRQTDNLLRMFDKSVWRKSVATPRNEKSNIEGIVVILRCKCYEGCIHIYYVECADIGFGPCRTALSSKIG
jgi:hypothetical protein